MKKTVAIIVVTMVLSTMFWGCDGSTVSDSPNGIMQPPLVLTDLLQASAQKDIALDAPVPGNVEYHIIVDDGKSMQGFIAPYCYSYSVVLNAIMDATFNGSRYFYKGSNIVAGKLTAVQTDAFLQDTNTMNFYMERNNSISDTITEIAAMAAVDEDKNDVYVFVSDIMIPSEDECMAASETLNRSFLSKEGMSAGVIGIMGDFSGYILNLPVDSKSGKARTIQEYAVIEKDEHNVFRHPIYIMFLGNERLVYQAMEKAVEVCQNSDVLDNSNPVNALFYYGYCAETNGQREMSISFNTSIEAYNKADYDMRYIFCGLPDEDGNVEYPADRKLDPEDVELLSGIPCISVYSGARPKKEQNIQLTCTVPYTVTRVPNTDGATQRDKFNLMQGKQKLDFEKSDYNVEVTLQKLSQGASSASYIWEDVEPTKLSLEKVRFDADSETAAITLALDASKLDLDAPQIYAVTIRIVVSPQWSEIQANYSFEWLRDWTLNIKSFTNEYRADTKKTSARFTSASTAATPYLYSLLGSGLGDGRIESVCNEITAGTGSFAQTQVFGVVVREIPSVINPNKKWDPSDDLGWAFSRESAVSILAELDESN